jgi:sarcosine oxidase
MDYDFAIVGTGGIGSAAFYHAARQGGTVVALEQFDAAHALGSSHGSTRIIRQAYFEHPNYVPLLREAYQLWYELEETTRRRLFIQSGLLEVGFPGGPVIDGILRSARQHDLPIEEISDQRFARDFGVFSKDPDQVALFERNAGYLFVEACVQAHIDAAVAAGGEFRPATRISDIQSNGKGVLIRTDHGDVNARHAILTAGAWSSQLLPQWKASLRVLRKHLFWFSFADRRWDSATGCPAFFYETRNGHFYGFPAIEGLVKVARHTGGELVHDPMHVDRSLDPRELDHIRGFTQSYLNQSVDQPNEHSVCMYTMSPDEHFIVDRHPEMPQIVFCAGLSGHGFKFASVLGKQLVRMALGESDPRLEFLSTSRLAIGGSESASKTSTS